MLAALRRWTTSAASGRRRIRQIRSDRVQRPPTTRVALDSTRCYPDPVSLPHEINQRDLRLRSKEIMDAVERGQDFTVTRGGREIARLVPLSSRRTFVPTAQFLALGQGLATDDPEQFRSDIDSMADPYQDDPFER